MTRRPRPSHADLRTDLRIGDAERERASRELADHYAEGRLDREEHAERLDRIWAARTSADLAPVFADLPGYAAPPVPAVAQPSAPRRHSRLPGPLLLVVVLGTIAVLTHLPLILIGLAAWFFLVRGCGSRRPHQRW